jgi:hypothetical protein
MKELAQHYQKTREKYPDDELVIVFDIDNTIIDMREMIAYVLRSYDREHETRYFADLKAEDLVINENQVDDYLAEIGLDEDARNAINDWYLEKRWTTRAILRSHRPFSGVMEVIRWFQMQPRTHVMLNTGRLEDVRHDTLRSLNSLGEEYKVRFSDDLLHMYPGTGEVHDNKVEVIRRLIESDYRVFAVVDNEPDNLEAIAGIDPDKEILPVHADTIFDSKRSRLPNATVSGSEYDLTELIAEKDLPGHIQFVWHGLNDRANLRQFLASDVRWGECDVRLDTDGKTAVLRYDSFKRRPRRDDEELLTLEEVLPQLLAAGKSIKLDLKENGGLIDAIIARIEKAGVSDDALWFNGNAEDLDRSVFERLSSQFPRAIIQCPVGFMVPMMPISPTVARERLEEFRSWGINRLSIDWKIRDLTEAMTLLEDWDWPVNLYNVPDLESFLQAVLLQPRSITSDFNFPKWNYFGRGAGANRSHHSYALDPNGST